MLVLGRALMSEPRLLCLDEPSLGLAPLMVREIFKTIRHINEAGTGVLLVEQNARYALETASRGYVLQTGSIVASGRARIEDRCAGSAGLFGRRCAFHVKYGRPSLLMHGSFSAQESRKPSAPRISLPPAPDIDAMQKFGDMLVESVGIFQIYRMTGVWHYDKARTGLYAS